MENGSAFYEGKHNLYASLSGISAKEATRVKIEIEKSLLTSSPEVFVPKSARAAALHRPVSPPVMTPKQITITRWWIAHWRADQAKFDSR